MVAECEFSAESLRSSTSEVDVPFDRGDAMGRGIDVDTLSWLRIA